jgi:DNA-binding FadR family transcriptional regulator
VQCHRRLHRRSVIFHKSYTGHTRRSFAEADLAFHLAIGVATANPLMRSVGSVIEAALVASFTYSSPVDEPANQDATVQAHAAIVDAIEARDAPAAADAMLEVIDVGVRRIGASRKKRKAKR